MKIFICLVLLDIMVEERKMYKRTPAIEKNISNIVDTDTRIRILGTILDMSESSVLIDDGSGKIEIEFDDSQEIIGLVNGQTVRIICKVLPLIDGYACKGECVQRMDGFDRELYNKTKKICNG